MNYKKDVKEISFFTFKSISDRQINIGYFASDRVDHSDQNNL
ncbi:hypothetical protein SAMN05421754_102535 [Nitrosomonas sp. Nm58]|nr:hypothetical protein SAMN05421754_102535 [Nitrosomonas sp. Nm58]